MFQIQVDDESLDDFLDWWRIHVEGRFIVSALRPEPLHTRERYLCEDALVLQDRSGHALCLLVDTAGLRVRDQERQIKPGESRSIWASPPHQWSLCPGGWGGEIGPCAVYQTRIDFGYSYYFRIEFELGDQMIDLHDQQDEMVVTNRPKETARFHSWG